MSTKESKRREKYVKYDMETGMSEPITDSDIQIEKLEDWYHECNYECLGCHFVRPAYYIITDLTGAFFSEGEGSQDFACSKQCMEKFVKKLGLTKVVP